MAAAVHVACLCAAWCRLCEDWRAVQQQVAADFAAEGEKLRWHWIDIEDEAEWLGDVEVETFPTVVIVGFDGVVRFAGPLQPQAAVLRRVLRSCLDGQPDAAGHLGVDPALLPLASKLLNG